MSCENESGSVCGKNNTAMTQGHLIKETGTDWERNWRYNAAGRLSEIKDSADGLTVQYRYDPFGRRIAKTVTQGATSRTTYYINGESALMAEADEEGRITRAYGFNPHTQQARTNEEDEDAEEGSLWSTDPIWQADLAAGQSLKDASYHYLVTDHLGTPVLALNKAGETTWKARYEAFGKARIDHASTAQINLRLPGQYFDAETGLHQNWNRDYAPGIGRYVQADPLGIFGGMNVYEYAAGNPLIYVDPEGNFAWGLAFAGIDLAWQLYRYKGNWKCVNWGDIGLSLLGGGFTSALLKKAFIFKPRGPLKIVKNGKVWNPHSWNATVYWMKKNNIMNIKPGQHRHHWLFERNQGIGKNVPDWIKNQPWNLNPINSRLNSWLASHPRLAWIGAPSWAPEIIIGTGFSIFGDKGINGNEDPECGCI